MARPHLSLGAGSLAWLSWLARGSLRPVRLTLGLAAAGLERLWLRSPARVDRTSEAVASAARS